MLWTWWKWAPQKPHRKLNRFVIKWIIIKWSLLQINYIKQSQNIFVGENWKVFPSQGTENFSMIVNSLKLNTVMNSFGNIGSILPTFHFLDLSARGRSRPTLKPPSFNTSTNQQINILKAVTYLVVARVRLHRKTFLFPSHWNNSIHSY